MLCLAFQEVTLNDSLASRHKVAVKLAPKKFISVTLTLKEVQTSKFLSIQWVCEIFVKLPNIKIQI